MRACTVCGNDFLPRHGRQRYCYKPCAPKRAMYRKGYCRGCGQPLPEDVGPRSLHCNDACRQRTRRRAVRRIGNANRAHIPLVRHTPLPSWREENPEAARALDAEREASLRRQDVRGTPFRRSTFAETTLTE